MMPEATLLKRNARLLPRPWRHYAACHGSLRACYWFPRWRDAVRCAVLGHRWFAFDANQVMCERCVAGPIDLSECDA